MAEPTNLNVTGLNEYISKLDNLAEQLPKIETKALKAVGKFIADRLREMTPVSSYIPTAKGTSLPPETLRQSVQYRVKKNRDSGKREVVIGFGRYSWIAWCVEKGQGPRGAYMASRGAEGSTEAEATG